MCVVLAHVMACGARARVLLLLRGTHGYGAVGGGRGTGTPLVEVWCSGMEVVVPLGMWRL